MVKCAKVHNYRQKARNDRHILAGQHIYCREQGRHALNLQQAGFERAAQEYERAARDGVSVAVARATEMSGAEMLARKDALEHRAEQSWTSHSAS